MAYKLNNKGQEVQQVIDEMQTRTPTATPDSSGFLSAHDKRKIDDLDNWEEITNEEILQIWKSTTQ